MEHDKIICGYHTLINWNKTNNEKVIAMIEVRVTPQRGQGFDRIAERIYNFSEVNSVYLISGGFDPVSYTHLWHGIQCPHCQCSEGKGSFL